MSTPLAEKLRPQNLDEFIGQEHLVGNDGPIRKMIQKGVISSMIFWGPPGVGKTTLARIIQKSTHSEFVLFSAVTGGINEIRKIITKAEELKKLYGKETILFVDEIHRFNKSQQDAFLPHVESGTITLIGATTENPGFEVNAPLISRSKVYVFNKLNDKDIKKLIQNAIKLFPNHKFTKEALEFLINNSNGDARSAINSIELITSISNNIDLSTVEKAIQKKSINYDKKGDSHYDTISAFIKSMRGGDPNATLHYLARMIKAGEDPMFIARRMVIFASEDIGNAKPTALILATTTMQAVHMVGMPEAQLILAQCATYLATCKKSIASTVGIMEALSDLEKLNIDPIPLNLRNAENKVMKDLGFGKGYIRYPWLEELKTGKKINQQYLPGNIKNKKYYRPEW